MVPKTPPCGPIQPIMAHFGPGPEIYVSPFGPKCTKIFWEIFFVQNDIIWVPKGSGALKNPKLTSGTSQWTAFCPILGKRTYAFSGLPAPGKIHFFRTFFPDPDHFPWGSKWFWCPKNDKMYTIGPTERPRGVRNGPRRAQSGPQNPSGWPDAARCSLFWPNLAYFDQDRIFCQVLSGLSRF